jgi:hypothetical protein
MNLQQIEDELADDALFRRRTLRGKFRSSEVCFVLLMMAWIFRLRRSAMKLEPNDQQFRPFDAALRYVPLIMPERPAHCRRLAHLSR